MCLLIAKADVSVNSQGWWLSGHGNYDICNNRQWYVCFQLRPLILLVFSQSWCVCSKAMLLCWLTGKIKCLFTGKPGVFVYRQDCCPCIQAGMTSLFTGRIAVLVHRQGWQVCLQAEMVCLFTGRDDMCVYRQGWHVCLQARMTCLFTGRDGVLVYR